MFNKCVVVFTKLTLQCISTIFSNTFNKNVLSDKTKSIIKFSFFLALGIFLVWWPLSNFSPEAKTEMRKALQDAEYFWLILSAFFAILSHLSRAMRWQMLIETFDKRPRLINAFLAIMVGYLANLAFPRLGEITRCGIINRYEKIPMDKAFGTVITERLLDVVMLLLFTALAVLLQFKILGYYFTENILQPLLLKIDSLGSNWLLYGLMIAGVLSLGLLAKYLSTHFRETAIYKKLQNLMLGVWEGIKSVKNVKNLPLFIAHTFFIWTMYFVMIYACFFTTEFTSGLGPQVGLAVFVFGSFAVVATQGGIGAYPLMVAAVLALYDIPYELGYVFGWIAWSGQTFMLLLVGFASLVLLPIVNKKEAV